MPDPHLDALLRALADEESAQRREHETLVALPLPERVTAGVTWAPLRLDPIEELGRGRFLARVRPEKGGALHDGIGAGEPVELAAVGALGAVVAGTCIGADHDVAEIVLGGDFEGEGPVAVTRRFDATTFARYRAALKLADQRQSAVRDVLLGRRVPGGFPPVLHDDPAFVPLDPAQRDAARLAISAAEVALVHGPPGTGKTRVIVALLQALVRRGERPWALADSNAAVDHLAVRAASAGLDVVRIGHPARIGSAAAGLSLDARVAAGPFGPVLRDLDREWIRAHQSAGGDGWRLRKELAAERDRVEAQARAAILDRANVIASTFGTLGRAAPDLPPVVTAIVDEATQAIEPAVWTCIPYVERLILVGDPHQLGPVVTAPGNALATSLLDRMLATAALPMPMLQVQRRMNADVQALVDDVYTGSLTAHPSVAGHLLRDLPGVRDTPLTGRAVVFVDTAGAGFEEQRDPVTWSLYNEGEIEVVRRAVRQLRDAGVPADAIGVVTPYSAQVARLRAVVDVEVATVNAFQGRENEAIVCSFVRSNPEAQLGFVADPRRLTVALTRARRFLLCTGDSATLCANGRFAALLDAAQAQGALQSVWEEPWA